ncbi:MAG: anhydro-N-acetylmuramic acid kinase [Propionibacteriaceae bacterium]|jgi:anhydro-N-acetylmuramic acid kinase|nr:anhydro-N-acetylmuramic acid kinase [Propionibacteriaceae bacterium]
MIVLGLNSGTSVDSIDVAAARLTTDADGVVNLEPLGFLSHPWTSSEREALLAALPGRMEQDAGSRSSVAACGAAECGGGDGTTSATVDTNPVAPSDAERSAPHPATPAFGAAQWCQLDTMVGQALARAAACGAQRLVPHDTVDLVASHGQTIYHWVDNGHVHGTLQIGQPAWVAAAVGCPVVSDLRSADIAAGGQGAPLIGLLDGLWLGPMASPQAPMIALNIGGISNISVITGVDQPVIAWDTGPGNCLIDATAQRLTGQSCDRDGALAAQGEVDQVAVERLLADPYYAAPAPKSTGRELFTESYVARLVGPNLDGVDLMATLTQLTATTIADAIATVGRPRSVVVSGGGAHNPVLMARLRALLDAPVVTADDFGLPVDAKEAYLFALLGYLSVHGSVGTACGVNGRSATGAAHRVVLGSLTPPTPLALNPLPPLRALRVVQRESSPTPIPSPMDDLRSVGPTGDPSAADRSDESHASALGIPAPPTSAGVASGGNPPSPDATPAQSPGSSDPPHVSGVPHTEPPTPYPYFDPKDSRD